MTVLILLPWHFNRFLHFSIEQDGAFTGLNGLRSILSEEASTTALWMTRDGNKGAEPNIR